MEVKNKKIVVTGASKGIGKNFCKRMAQENVQLALVIRKRDVAFEEMLISFGAKSVKTFECDLSDLNELKKITEELKTFEPDILFNNAGLLTGGLLEEQNMDEIHKMFSVNINALVHLTHGILPGMIARKRGKIVNHGSVSSVMYFPCASTYAASKAAVLAFTQSLATELKSTGVSTLLLLTPGVKTEMFDKIAPLYGNHIEMKIPYISTEQYVEQIFEAIVEDIEVLTPSGLTGLNLKLAKYFPPVFKYFAQKTFKR